MKRRFLILAGLFTLALLLIPFRIHRHSLPEKPFVRVPDVSATLSPYDELIREYADSIGWDWRLVAAIVRQESRFNPQVQSAQGAVGLMQIQSPRYSAQQLLDPGMNLRIGTRYLKKLEGMFPAATALDTLEFTLGAFNMGDGKMRRLQAEAAEKGLDPTRWDDVMSLFPRGHHTLRYVRSILRTYDEYRYCYPSSASVRVLSDTVPTN